MESKDIDHRLVQERFIHLGNRSTLIFLLYFSCVCVTPLRDPNYKVRMENGDATISINPFHICLLPEFGELDNLSRYLKIGELLSDYLKKTYIRSFSIYGFDGESLSIILETNNNINDIHKAIQEIYTIKRHSVVFFDINLSAADLDDYFTYTLSEIDNIKNIGENRPLYSFSRKNFIDELSSKYGEYYSESSALISLPIHQELYSPLYLWDLFKNGYITLYYIDIISFNSKNGDYKMECEISEKFINEFCKAPTRELVPQTAENSKISHNPFSMNSEGTVFVGQKKLVTFSVNTREYKMAKYMIENFNVAKSMVDIRNAIKGNEKMERTDSKFIYDVKANLGSLKPYVHIVGKETLMLKSRKIKTPNKNGKKT